MLLFQEPLSHRQLQSQQPPRSCSRSTSTHSRRNGKFSTVIARDCQHTASSAEHVITSWRTTNKTSRYGGRICSISNRSVGERLIIRTRRRNSDGKCVVNSTSVPVIATSTVAAPNAERADQSRLHHRQFCSPRSALCHRNQALYSATEMERSGLSDTAIEVAPARTPIFVASTISVCTLDAVSSIEYPSTITTLF